MVWSGDMSAKTRTTRTIGADRLVSVQPLADAVPMLSSDVPEICPFPGTDLDVHVGYQAQADLGAVPTSGTVRGRLGNINNSPLRQIQDPHPAWSAIAVNAENNMVVIADENLYRLVEYSRLDNTPPTGPPTEPRRVIGGPNTRTERICGMYIDPKTLEIYATNNDTQNWMPVFSREARGNAVPDRVLATPHRTWGIAADEMRQELYLTVQSPSAVVVYRKAAAENEAPLRLLEGDATELADPHGIAVDVKNDLLVVANHGHRRFYGGAAVSTLTRPWEEWVFASPTALRGLPRRLLPGLGAFELPSINIYARGGSGNTPPLRVIKGPRTQLNWPSHVAVHEGRGEIFVANDASDSVLVFRESDRGDAAPIRVIRGLRTLLKNPTGLAVDATNNELWVANMGNYAAIAFPVNATGDVAPIRTIRGGPPNQTALMIGNPGAVAYDSKRQQVLVPN
jgi:DNA-binding beta-propeller fold protein YncE